MATPKDWPITGDMAGWMRGQEKRIMHEERRPRITSARDLLGPGIAPHAVEIRDWNGDETLFNGFFFSRPGALNAPDSTSWWAGQTITLLEGWSIQEVYDLRGTSSPITKRTRRVTSITGIRTFSAWA